MMGMASNDVVEPAPQEAVNKYKISGRKEDGPSKEQFQADFSEASPQNSPWNVRLAVIFADDYVREGLIFSELSQITDYFYTYLQTLRTKHRNTATANSNGSGTVRDRRSKLARIDQRKKTVMSSPPPCYTYQSDV
jgi:hypothetical protein